MQPMKNVAASAKSGMEKTKATVQEKVEKMSSRDPVEKEEATQKKDARIAQAEMEKQEARAHNANTHPTGATGHSTGLHQMPGQGTGQPTGHVTDGVVGSHPLGSNNSRVGETGPTTGGTHNY